MRTSQRPQSDLEATDPRAPFAVPDGAEADQATRWAVEAELLLAERERQRATETIEVTLPAHLSVSQLVALQRDPQRLARRLERSVTFSDARQPA